MNHKHNFIINQDDDMNFVELYTVIKAHSLVIILVSVLFAVSAYLVSTYTMVPQYQSSAILIVNNRRNEPDSIITTDEITSAQNLAAVYSIIIKSEPVMGQVIANLSASISPGALAQKVSVSAVDDTQVISISVRDQDPLIAQQYVDEIVNVAPDIIVHLVEAGSVGIVSRPTIPTSPVSPNIRLNTLAAFIVGLTLSVGFVLLVHLLDRTYQTSETIENDLGYPVIGIIPNYERVNRGTQ